LATVALPPIDYPSLGMSPFQPVVAEASAWGWLGDPYE